MIVTRAKAEEAWNLLRSHARVVSEEWDEPSRSFQAMDEHLFKHAHRTAARLTHPDTGGRAEDFARVDWAKCVLEKWLAKNEDTVPVYAGLPCKVCGGTGKVRLQRGFTSIPTICGACKGSGDDGYDKETARE